MDVERHLDPAAFRERVADLVLEDETRHNLFLGLLGTLVERPAVHPAYRLWSVQDGDRVVGAALRTPPHLLVLAAPRDPEALDALSARLVADAEVLPGVVGGLPEVEELVRVHGPRTGLVVAARQDQGIYRLEAVDDVPLPAGRMRAAVPHDLAWILAWTRDFAKEAMPDLPFDEDDTRRRLAQMLSASRDRGYGVWETEAPTCLVGFGSPTPHGVRIGPVYTPPAERRRGYGTALVAAVSRSLLERGHRFCFLYTDLANPTSNAIYQRIGYRLHARSAMIRFA